MLQCLQPERRISADHFHGTPSTRSRNLCTKMLCGTLSIVLQRGRNLLTQRDQHDESRLFLDAMDGVKPLKPHNLAAPVPPQSKLPSQSPAIGKVPESADLDGLEFVRSGIQRSMLSKLRNGRIAIETELDLHGYSVQETQQALNSFLTKSRLTGRQRAVRIIHGKGRGSPDGKSILRTAVVQCLLQSDAVLAFSPAGFRDGGDGAVHVLLKRR